MHTVVWDQWETWRLGHVNISSLAPRWVRVESQQYLLRSRPQWRDDVPCGYTPKGYQFFDDMKQNYWVYDSLLTICFSQQVADKSVNHGRKHGLAIHGHHGIAPQTLTWKKRCGYISRVSLLESGSKALIRILNFHQDILLQNMLISNSEAKFGSVWFELEI